jgi:hypothetical protein
MSSPMMDKTPQELAALNWAWAAYRRKDGKCLSVLSANHGEEYGPREFADEYKVDCDIVDLRSYVDKTPAAKPAEIGGAA